MMSKTLILSLAAAVAALVANEGSSVETEGHDNKGALRNKNGMLVAATAGVLAMGAASIGALQDPPAYLEAPFVAVSTSSQDAGSMQYSGFSQEAGSQVIFSAEGSGAADSEWSDWSNDVVKIYSHSGSDEGSEPMGVSDSSVFSHGASNELSTKSDSTSGDSNSGSRF